MSTRAVASRRALTMPMQPPSRLHLEIRGQITASAETTTTTPVAAEAATPPSLGILIGIVVSVTLLVSVVLGFLCGWASRRRSGRLDPVVMASHRGEPTSIGDGHDSGSNGSGGRLPRKLRKREGSVSNSKREPPPIRTVSSAPVLPRVPSPWSSSRRTSFNRFGLDNSSSGLEKDRRSRSSPHRRNSNWIDEDAIHGPRMKKQGSGFGEKSLRNSWSLKIMMAPPQTLPRSNLAGLPPYSHKKNEDSLVISRPSENSTDAVPFPKLLPHPRPVLVTPNRPAPQQSPPRPFVYEEVDQGRPMASSGDGGGCAERPSAAPDRKPLTDSTLAEILQSTERRLQEGAMTGVARRNRLAASPTRRKEDNSRKKLVAPTVTSITRTYEFVDDEDDMSAMQPMATRTQLARTPSPPKPSRKQSISLASQGQARNNSEVSDVSEPDSMFCDPTATDLASEATAVATRLTSPSRGPSKCSVGVVESPLTASSGSLSTLYSEEESAQADNTQVASLPPLTKSKESHRFSASRNGEVSDPFAISPDTPTSVHGTSIRLSLSGKLSLKCPPRPMKTTPGESSPTPVRLRSNTERTLCSASPHGKTEILTGSPISRASDKSRLETQQLLGKPTLRTEMRSGIFPAPPLVPPRSSEGERGLTDEDLLPAMPDAMATSPIATKTVCGSPFSSSRNKLERPTVRRIVPPPHVLRVDRERGSSPTLGEANDFVSVVNSGPTSSPALSQNGTLSSSLGGRYINSAIESRHARGDSRVISTASSVYSQHAEDSRTSAGSDKMTGAGVRQALRTCLLPMSPAMMATARGRLGVVNDAAVVANGHLPPLTSADMANTLRQEKKGLLTARGDGAGIFGMGEKYLVTGAIAELRRMNSQVSIYSAVSWHLGDAGGIENASESPTIPQLRGGGFSPLAKPAGTKNYLALGTIRQEEAAGVVDRDHAGSGGSISMVTRHVDGLQAPPAGAVSSPRRDSSDSLGLYDNEGFLISSPERARGAGAMRSRGLRI